MLVPAHAGVLSAYGLLTSDYAAYAPRPDSSRSTRMRLSVLPEPQRLPCEDVAAARGVRLPGGGVRFELTLGMRFVGQSHEIGVDIDHLPSPISRSAAP